MHAERLTEPTRTSRSWQAMLGWSFIGVAAVATSSAAPLLGLPVWSVGLGWLFLLVMPLLIAMPQIALSTTLVVMLLPNGLLPADLQSNLVLILLGGTLLLWLLQTAFQRRVIVWTVPILLIVLFYLWAFLSLVWATDLIVSRRELIQYSLVILVAFLLINQVDTLARLNWLLQTLALSGWILVGTALWTLWRVGFVAGERFQIFSLNENTLSTLLILAAAGVLWPTVRNREKSNRGRMVWSLIYLGFAIGLSALSGSRGGLIAFIALFVAFGFTGATRWLARWSFVVLLLLLVTVPTLFVTVTERFATSTAGDDLGGRDLLWEAGLLLIADHYATGAGVGNGPYLMPVYINAVADEDHLWDRLQYPAHNPLIEVGTDLGLPGIALYLAFLATAAWHFFLAWTVARQQQNQTISAYCALIACVSVGLLLTWIKSGGMDSHLSIFVLVSLWVIPSRLVIVVPSQRQKSGSYSKKVALSWEF